MQAFFDMIKSFFGGNGLYALVFLIVLSYIGIMQKKEKKIFILIIVILTILIFNPISYNILSVKSEFKAGYYRFLWICPYGLILAYGLGEIIKTVDKKSRVGIAFISCMLIFAICIPKHRLALPDNKYQIPDETVYVGDELERLRIENDKDQVRVFVDMNLGNTIRQYNANICLCIDINRVNKFSPDYNEYDHYGLYFMLANNRTDIPPENVARIAKNHIVDYLVISDENQNVLTYLLGNGWISVGKTPQYTIIELKKQR